MQNAPEFRAVVVFRHLQISSFTHFQNFCTNIWQYQNSCKFSWIEAPSPFSQSSFHNNITSRKNLWEQNKPEQDRTEQNGAVFYLSNNSEEAKQKIFIYI